MRLGARWTDLLYPDGHSHLTRSDTGWTRRHSLEEPCSGERQAQLPGWPLGADTHDIHTRVAIYSRQGPPSTHQSLSHLRELIQYRSAPSHAHFTPFYRRGKLRLREQKPFAQTHRPGKSQTPIASFLPSKVEMSPKLILLCIGEGAHAHANKAP